MTQNANGESEREGNPQTWGSQTRRIPLPWHNARKKRSATQRQARFAGGMFCVLHDLHRSSPPRTINLESKRKFPPYFKRSAEMGGRKRAVIPAPWHGAEKKAHCFKNAGAFWGGWSFPRHMRDYPLEHARTADPRRFRVPTLFILDDQKSMDQAQTRAPFGTLLGVAPGGVPVYSSNYDVGAEELDRSDFVSLIDDIYMGYKWQCVELARRWLYSQRGLIFEEVGMAYEIFGLTSLRDPRTNKTVPLKSFRNGSRRPPEVGCMIIWDEGGEFERTGHVAIVTQVHEDRIAIIEQNNRDEVWPDGQTFSREISMREAYDGGTWLRSPMKEGTILGWVIQTEDATYAQPDMSADALEMSLSVQVVPENDRADGSWLNEANADEAMYAQVMRGWPCPSLSRRCSGAPRMTCTPCSCTPPTGSCKTPKSACLLSICRALSGRDCSDPGRIARTI